MAVGLSTFQEQSLELIHLRNKLFTHRLTQRVALASREVGQQTRQKHDLFLIHSHPIGILQVFLHDGDIVSDGAAAMLSGNEVRDIVHRARTVEGIHGYEILECRRLEFAQIFLHAGGLKLECADSASLAVKLIGLGVSYVDIVNVDVDTLGLLDVGESLLDDREGL